MKKKKLILLSILTLFIMAGSAARILAQIEKVKILKGTVIVIDPGHGGNDPGAKAGSIDEDEINLSISLKLKELLKDAGASVILTRDADYDLAPQNTSNIKRADMQARAEILNQNNVTLFISIHGNISLDKSCKGAEAYYRINDENSKKLAECVLERLRELTDSRYQVKKGDFYLLNNTSTLGILVETGFLSNPSDLFKLQNESYQSDISEAIFLGIVDYLKILL